MKRQLSEIEALINEKYFESRMDMIPASIKETICEIGGKKVIVSRELIIKDRTMIGVEYTPDGLIAGAFTTDKNGKKIKVESNYETAENHHTPQNLISERLEEISKSLAKEKAEADHKFAENVAARDTAEKAPKKKVRKQTLSEEDIRRKQMEEYNRNRRGC